MNKIILIGNLTRDPELRTTPNGISVCSFTIAVNRKFASQGGERQTDFFRINTWRQLADTCQKFLLKGRKVAVVGELQARTYAGNDGVTRMSLEVSADEVEFLTPKGQQEGGYEGGYSSTQNAPHATGSPMQELAGFENISEDELPF
jgi:single-strand DNA-binding protein